MKNDVKRHQVIFLLLLVLGGCGKTAAGFLIFSSQWAAMAALALLILIVGFAASRLVRRHQSDGELGRIADLAGTFGSLVYGTVLLVLFLADWRRAVIFVGLLLVSSPRLLAHLPLRRAK